MSRSWFWLSDVALAEIEPHLPKNQPRGRRAVDRRVISGIVHMLKCDGRWADAHQNRSPRPRFFNHCNGLGRGGIWSRILAGLTEKGWISETDQIDSSYIKAHCDGTLFQA